MLRTFTRRVRLPRYTFRSPDLNIARNRHFKMSDVDALRASIPAISAKIKELRAQKADDALIKEQQAKLADTNKRIAALAIDGKGDASRKGPRLNLKTPKVSLSRKK